MLIMPILNTSKNGISKIYNVEVKLKTATKVKENTKLKGFEESDVIIGGTSFNKSIYNTKNREDNVIVNFIRSSNYRNDRNDFLITTRSNSNSTLYDLYNVSIPPRKVTAGLDNLYGKVITDMQKEIPNIKRGRYISLKDLGVCSHINNNRISSLKYIVDKSTDEENLKYLLLANSLGDLKSTIDFIKLFDFTIISEATVDENQIKDLVNSLQNTYTRDVRNLKRYYEIAKDNKEEYKKLSSLNKILYGKSINLIKSKEKSKILVKSSDNRMGTSDDVRAA